MWRSDERSAAHLCPMVLQGLIFRTVDGGQVVVGDHRPDHEGDASTLGELDLTPEGEKTGEWYGSADYRDAFPELWGLNA